MIPKDPDDLLTIFKCTKEFDVCKISDNFKLDLNQLIGLTVEKGDCLYFNGLLGDELLLLRSMINGIQVCVTFNDGFFENHFVPTNEKHDLRRRKFNV